MKQVVVSGSFDDLRSRHIRLLHEASKLGTLHVLLWSDRLVGNPKFPEAERLYLVQAIRYVTSVRVVDDPRDTGPVTPDLWVNEESVSLEGFPVPPPMPTPPGRKKVLVTGCFDWFHSGHVRFFEEVSQLGDLYVVVGHDENIRLLKGDGHPFFKQEERRYCVGSVRYVKEALISTGHGWLDAEPEIYRIRPDLYVVNEDGDRPEKRAFCEKHGIEYRVLKRRPKDGLPARSSTILRGF